MEYTTIPLSRAKTDVINILKRYNVEVKEVAACNANIIYRKDYTTYIYSHEYSTLEARIKNFMESKEYKEAGSPTIYVWVSTEGQYKYLNIGYFLPTKNNFTELAILTIGIAQY